MRSWKKKALIATLVGSALAAGVVSALPATGYEITYYDVEGNVVGERSYYCGPRVYGWGQITPIYDRIDFPCP